MSDTTRSLLPDRLLNADETAEHYGVSRAHVYNLMHRGMPSVKLGRSRRFRLSQCDAWLDAEAANTSTETVS